MVNTTSNLAEETSDMYSTSGAMEERNNLAPGLGLTRYELAVIAPHYLEYIYANYANEGESSRSTGGDAAAFALERLAIIGSILGSDALRRALASVKDESSDLPRMDKLLGLETERDSGVETDNGGLLPGDVVTPNEPRESEGLGRTPAGLPYGPAMIAPPRPPALL